MSKNKSSAREYRGRYDHTDILAARARVGKYIAGVFCAFLPMLAIITAVVA